LLAAGVREVLAGGRPDAVVVGTGPGPFTGHRVGLVTTAALSDAYGIPAYGVCSLDGIAPPAWVANVNHQLFRAYLLKEQLREVFALKGEQGKQLLDSWLNWVGREGAAGSRASSNSADASASTERRSTRRWTTGCPTVCSRAPTPRSGS